jgi:hypothetical protein
MLEWEVELLESSERKEQAEFQDAPESVRRCPLELPLRGSSMVEGKLSNRPRDGAAMVLCTRENSPTAVRTVQFGGFSNCEFKVK